MGFVRYRKLVITAMLLCWGLGCSNFVLAKQACTKNKGKVTRALFTTAIKSREPVDHVLILENDVSEIFFFTELRYFQGQTITHRWEFDSQEIDRKTFTVKGSRWRVHSAQQLPRNMIGKWTVTVEDEDGCPLRAAIFKYVQRNGEAIGSAILPP